MRKKWIIAVFMIIFVFCGCQPKENETDSETAKQSENVSGTLECRKIMAAVDVGNLYLQKGTAWNIETEGIEPSWLQVSMENGVLKVTY